MKQAVVAFAFVLATAPAFVSAQTVPPSPAPSAASPLAAEMSAGMSMMSRMMQVQQRARAASLAALTPGHRELLARIVGELAIAPDPNFDASAARLDAALSPAEVQALGRAEAAKRAEMAAQAGQMQSTLQSTLSPEQLKAMQQDAVQAMQAASTRSGPELAKMVRAQSDPGHVLLQTILLGVQPLGKMFNTMMQPSSR